MVNFAIDKQSNIRKEVRSDGRWKALGQYTKIVVETDEKNPVTIAVIQSNFVDTTEGYRVRLTPKYD